jgi:hypothetical protein
MVTEAADRANLSSMSIEPLKQYFTLAIMLCFGLTVVSFTVAVAWTIGYYIFALWTSQLALPGVVKPL